MENLPVEFWVYLIVTGFVANVYFLLRLTVPPFVRASLWSGKQIAKLPWARICMGAFTAGTITVIVAGPVLFGLMVPTGMDKEQSPDAKTLTYTVKYLPITEQLFGTTDQQVVLEWSDRTLSYHVVSGSIQNPFETQIRASAEYWTQIQFIRLARQNAQNQTQPSEE